MLEAKPPTTPDAWAGANRIMPKDSPEPGQYRPERTPYWIPLQRNVALPGYHAAAAVCGTQMAKSTIFENIVGWRLDTDPCPIIYYSSTEDIINDVVEPRFMDMFEQCASLSRKLNVLASNQHQKEIAGTTLTFGWLGSASKAASITAGLVIVDEIDRVKANNGEGDILRQLDARGDAFPGSKTIYASTPSLGRVTSYVHPRTGLRHWAKAKERDVPSRIWKLWQSGTRHEWAVPCPHCGHYFIPRPELLWYPGKGTDSPCSPDEAYHAARLTCETNGCLIEGRYRLWMNARGHDVAPGNSVSPAQTFAEAGHDAKPGEKSGEAETRLSNKYTIWVSGLCSFSGKRSYGQLAQMLREAEESGDPAVMQSVINTGFGQCYWPAGKVPSWEQVKELRAGYLSKTILPGTLKLLCTVDVQKRRLVYVVRGWLGALSSYLVEAGELFCPPGTTTEDADIWEELEDLLENGRWDGRAIDHIGVDCGYNDEPVFAFVRPRKYKARALRGEDSLSKPFRAINLDTDHRGKTRKFGDQRWEFDSAAAKAWVHSRIHRPKDKPGFWLIPADVSDDYCKQLVAEELGDDGTWVQTHDDNHYLDCEAMQCMLARMLGLDRRAFGEAPPLSAAPESPPSEIESPQPGPSIEPDSSSDWLGAVGNWMNP